MDSVTSTAIANASNADLSSVRGSASVLVLRKALDAQASTAAQLIQALPQAPLATSGSLGTQVNTYA